MATFYLTIPLAVAICAIVSYGHHDHSYPMLFHASPYDSDHDDAFAASFGPQFNPQQDFQENPPVVEEVNEIQSPPDYEMHPVYASLQFPPVVPSIPHIPMSVPAPDYSFLSEDVYRQQFQHPYFESDDGMLDADQPQLPEIPEYPPIEELNHIAQAQAQAMAQAEAQIEAEALAENQALALTLGQSLNQNQTQTLNQTSQAEALGLIQTLIKAQGQPLVQAQTLGKLQAFAQARNMSATDLLKALTGGQGGATLAQALAQGQGLGLGQVLNQSTGGVRTNETERAEALALIQTVLQSQDKPLVQAQAMAKIQAMAQAKNMTPADFLRSFAGGPGGLIFTQAAIIAEKSGLNLQGQGLGLGQALNQTTGGNGTKGTERAEALALIQTVLQSQDKPLVQLQAMAKIQAMARAKNMTPADFLRSFAGEPGGEIFTQAAIIAEKSGLNLQNGTSKTFLTDVMKLPGAKSLAQSLRTHMMKGPNNMDHALPKNLTIIEGKMTNDPNVIIPFVSTPLGVLVGKSYLSRSGKWYYGFQGIPYAEPPKRYEPAVPVKKWTGVRDAQHNASVCPQNVDSEVIGNEDCLFLNVYHPHPERCVEDTPSGHLPVIFYIHGGAFFMGTGSSAGPKYLMDECVVFVSINYRLGALGFLTTEDGVIPGNLGLKDQVLALQWVKEYISFFRGDPNLVTIMGMSAGASSASHLIASPMAKGLFHRAIANSGSALNPWSISKNTEFVKMLAGGVKCPTNTSSSALKDCLVAKDFKQIILTQSQGTNRSLLLPFGPVIESEAVVNPFQTQNPAVRLRNGDFNKVPLLTGFTQDEGIGLFSGGILATPDLTNLIKEAWPIAAPTVLDYSQLNITDEQKGQFTTKIRQFYFGKQEIGQETRENLTNLFSDRFIVQGTFEDAELHSKFASVFPYVMTYKGGRSLAFKWGYQKPAVTHTDDFQFFFNDPDPTSNATDFLPGTEQFAFSRKVITLWTAFAKTGSPVSVSPDWHPVKGRANSQWFQLDLHGRTLTNYLDDRRQFWENLGIYKAELN